MKKNGRAYRLLEMVPGIFAWTAITFPIWGAFVFPRVVAYFVIAFLIYWLYQSFKSAFLAIIGYFKILSSQNTSWDKLYQQQQASDWLDYQTVSHVVIISSNKEPVEVIDMAISSLSSQIDINLKQIHVVVAQEARAGLENNTHTINYFRSKKI